MIRMRLAWGCVPRMYCLREGSACRCMSQGRECAVPVHVPGPRVCRQWASNAAGEKESGVPDGPPVLPGAPLPPARCPLCGFPWEDHDAVDVGLGEYVQREATAPWLATYRLLKKSSPCIPEVAIRMASLSEFERSYSHTLLYPPQPELVRDLEGRQKSFSGKMYGFYVTEMRGMRDTERVIEQSFLKWHRSKEYDPTTNACRERGVRATGGGTEDAGGGLPVLV